MCAELLDFLPLWIRTEDDIRLQLNADVNENVVPEDDNYVDTREGSAFHILTQPFVQEQARMWDEMTTQAAVGFIPFAYGTYLDYHGEVLGVERKPATRATGQVRFSGLDGTFVASDTEVSPTQIDPDTEVPIFRTTESKQITGGSAVLAVEALDPGAVANVSTGAVDTLLSPVPNVTSIANELPLLGGADVEADEDYLRRILDQLAGQGPGNV